MTRSFALLARGFSRISSLLGESGFFRMSDPPCFTRSAEQVLHLAILDRMERDDSNASTWCELLPRGSDTCLERAELVVDGDAERLERARRGMDAAESIGRGEQLL